jgi:signal peptidase I
MKTKHVLREARVQLRRYQHRISDETRRAIEADIEKLAQTRRERRKPEARKIAESLLKKIRTHTPKTVWHHTIETVESLVVAVVVALAIRHFLVEPFRIPSGSMEPTLHGSTASGVYPKQIGDFIMVEKFAYGPKIPFTKSRLWTVKPKRWDIIVFSTKGINTEDGRPAASDPPRNFVKRVVGLPGETLEIRDGWLSVNGEKAEMPDALAERLIAQKPAAIAQAAAIGRRLDASYLEAPYEPAPERTYGYKKSHYLINLFGFHLLAQQNLDETVFIGPWLYGHEGQTFTVPEGHYFVMGDNTLESADSRAWGFVPFENIKGRVIFVWWPPRSCRSVN